MIVNSKPIVRTAFAVLAVIFILFHMSSPVMAETTDPVSVPSVNLNIGTSEDGQDMVSSIQLLVLLTIISLAPSILIMMTSFTRILVVLHFIRSALATQQSPPNQLLVGLALFLTLFIMSPVIAEVNENAIEPLSAGEIGQDVAFERGMAPIRTFMLEQLDYEKGQSDLAMFMDIARVEEVATVEDIPLEVIIPAFIISELRIAFIIGFVIYIPFIVIDMVVASTLMSMGMMMLPPVMISMPFKLLLFIMADGWNLIIKELVGTFY